VYVPENVLHEFDVWLAFAVIVHATPESVGAQEGVVGSPGHGPSPQSDARQKGMASASSVAQLTTIACAVWKPSGELHAIAAPPQLNCAVGKPETHDDVQVNPGDAPAGPGGPDGPCAPWSPCGPIGP